MVVRRKGKRATLVVDERFKTLLKVESALHGKTIYEFTREIGDNETLFTEYLRDEKEKGLRRKKGFGFKF